MAGLAKQYALCVAGDGLEAIAAREAATWSNVQHISVFARMKPEQKVSEGPYLNRHDLALAAFLACLEHPYCERW